MFVSVRDHKKLTTLSKDKAYRDSYLSTHARSGIAYQIQALREKLGLSQYGFACKIGMTQSVVSRLENPEYGKVTIQTLLQVAMALDVALQIRFCSYPEFLAAIADVSPAALAVDSIQETMKNVAAPIDRLCLVALSLPHSSVSVLYGKTLRPSPQPSSSLSGAGPNQSALAACAA